MGTDAETIETPSTDEEVETVDDSVDTPMLTQKQFSDAMAAEKAKASRSAAKKVRQELEAELGMSVDEIKKLRDEQAKAEAQQMTDIERKQKELDESLAAAEQSRVEVLQEKLDMRAERALIEGGVVNMKAASRLVALLGLGLEADDEQIAEAIESLREEMPEVFTAPESDDPVSQQVGRSGVPGRGTQPPKNPIPVTTPFEKGRERFQRAASKAPQNPLERLQR